MFTTAIFKRFLYFLLFPLFFFIIPIFNYSFAGYSPAQIKAAYNLPADGGANKTVAIIAPKHPNVESDLSTFSQMFNLPDCTQSNGCLIIVDKSTKYAQSGAGETSMDTQWVHAIAPQAKILLVEIGSVQVSGGTALVTKDMIDAINYVESQSGVGVLSMSFGDYNDDPTNCSLFTSANIVRFASSGDGGHGLGFPAICQQVTSVGGTTLKMNGNSVASETVWGTGSRGTGGGLSKTLQEPSYQSSYSVPQANGMRATPDVSAVADPATGATVIVFGASQVYGGTSLSAPIWAGIAALSSSQVNNDLLYNNAKNSYSTYFRDITSGGNGSCGYYCTAQKGYDYTTGLGSPIAVPGGSGTIGNSTTTTTTTPSGPTTTTTIPSTDYPYIKGETFLDSNKNTILDSGEPGVAGVKITLFGPYSTVYTTDSTGNFYFPKVPTGTYTMTAELNGRVIANVNPFEVKTGMKGVEGNIAVNPDEITTTTTTQQNGTTTTTTTKPSQGTTTTTMVYYNCVIDPSCSSNQKTIQFCPLKCTQK
jgi:subtilase family serine protease